jgi:hypothetical protein
MITVITDQEHEVAGVIDGDRVLIDPGALSTALGWELKPEGLCRDDVCVPVRDRAALFAGDQLDLVGVAAALRRPAVVDPEAGVMAVALPSEQRRQALQDRHAPAFTLPDIDGKMHSLDEWSGQKKLLFAWASW